MIAIVIVSYNSKIFLEDCLSSIFASTVDNLVVYLVDNNSSDGSVNFAKKNYPAVRVIESKENLGFAGGNNLGIREALKHKPEHIFLLNPDTIIAKDCLAKLLEKADQISLEKSEVDVKLLEMPEELQLFEQLMKQQKIVEPYLKQQNYNLVLQNLVTLKPFVDQFFDKIMVMVEDQKIKKNLIVF